MSNYMNMSRVRNNYTFYILFCIVLVDVYNVDTLYYWVVSEVNFCLYTICLFCLQANVPW